MRQNARSRLITGKQLSHYNKLGVGVSDTLVKTGVFLTTESGVNWF
jgi:hypothetical protein